ncbi:ThrC Threonine synthase [Burkholderiaceae bacterium]
MKYVSTRGGMQALEFSDILLEGLAPDGGLAVPEYIPQVSAQTLETWRALPYHALATEVLSLFVTDIERTTLAAMTASAYCKAAFKTEAIVPVQPLYDGLSLLRLSEGPTLAFKDMAMQFLGQVFPYVLKQRGSTLNILGATSGDTGSAAEYAMRGKEAVAVFMLSPHGRMSAFQRAQMYSLQDANIHNIAVKGVFDEAQDVVKALAGDLPFKSKYRLGAVNSINWARIAAQIVYYFHGWLRSTSGPGQEVSFTVPSGNFGNILAGHIARSMGLPIRRLVLATNENNVLEEFFRTGIYRPRGAAQTFATSSPSMDISRASNFERFVYDLVGRDAERVAGLWRALSREGFFDLSSMKPELERRYGFVAGCSTHQNRLTTIRDVHARTGMLIDPHTADGIKVAASFVEPGIPMLVLETALPAKFSEVIEEALGMPAPLPEGLEHLESLPQHFTVLPCDVASVRAYIIEHAGN